MVSYDTIARSLAAALLAGPLEIEGCADRAAKLFGRKYYWLRPLAWGVCNAFRDRARPSQIELFEFLRSNRALRKKWLTYNLKIVGAFQARSGMTPVSAASSWNLPAICTTAELAAWLEIPLSELDWFADLRSLGYKQDPGRLRHYHYRIMAKRFGAVRLIEAPKPRLKAIQRRILADILDHIPPHAAAHGFRPGRSVKTFAAPHTGKDVVMRIDLQDFFPSIRVARIRALFRTAGYPEPVADLLAGLTTNAAPLDVWDSLADVPLDQLRRARWLYRQPHLPQGSPTSPALANLAAYRLDCRLSALAASAGASYTRYADDLAFSGGQEFARIAHRFHLHVAAIAMKEGFSVNFRKTRIMRQGVRQRLAGVVVNRHMNVGRADYDRLKATLTNCVRLGPRSQNRDACGDFRAHLLGKIGFVAMINPARGARLKELFAKIAW